MIRSLPLLTVPFLVGVPLLLETSWPVLLLGAAAATLCILGTVFASVGAARAGATAALLDLAYASWWSAGPVAFAPALLFGLALLALIDGVDFARRFSGAEIDRAAVLAQLGYWGARAAATVALALALSVAAGFLATGLPPMARPVAAGIGILMAFAAGAFACLRPPR
jgi:hypothetical protein